MKTEKLQFRIPSASLEKVQEILEKLNVKARKFKSPEASVKIIDTEERPIQGDYKYDEVLKKKTWEILGYEKILTLEVDSEPIKLAGWTLLGALDRVRPSTGEEAFTVLRPVPNKTIPVEFRDRDHCDHCDKSIRRKTTYIVEHEDGRIKQVGSNCLKDFLGHDPERILWFKNWFGKIQEKICDEDWCSDKSAIRASLCFDIQKFLEIVSFCITRDGWLSKGKAYEKGIDACLATANVVADFYCVEAGIWNRPKEYESPEIKQEDKDLAKDAIEWAKKIDPETSNEYLYNLHIASKNSLVEIKQVGIVASLISTYLKELDKEINLKKFAQIKNEHVGEIKKRQEFKVECVSVRCFDTDWGCSAHHKLVTEDNHLLVWFASGSSTWLKEGETYTVKATVKKHDEYQGKKQTLINRVVEI